MNFDTRTVTLATSKTNIIAPGDRVIFYNFTLVPVVAPSPPDYAPAYFTVESVSSGPPYDVTFKESLPSNLAVGCFLANVDRTGSNFLLKDNVIRNHRARGMMLKSSNGMIANNHLENSTMGGIVFSPERGAFNDSDYTHSVTIHNNTIVGVGRYAIGHGSISVSSAYLGQFVHAYGSNDITISANKIDLANYGPIFVSSAAKIVIKDNVITNPFIPIYWPETENLFPPCCMPVPAQTAFYAEWVADLTLTNNCVYPSKDSKLESVLQIGDNVSGDFTGIKTC